MSKRTAVYDVYLREQLIYVGSSSKPSNRMFSHRLKGVVPTTATLKIVAWYETRAEALAAERERIETLRPPCNIAHNQGHEARLETVRAERHRQMDEGRAFWLQLEKDAVEYARKLHREGKTIAEISAAFMGADHAYIEKIVKDN